MAKLITELVFVHDLEVDEAMRKLTRASIVLDRYKTLGARRKYKIPSQEELNSLLRDALQDMQSATEALQRALG